MEYMNYCTRYHFEEELTEILLPCETVSYIKTLTNINISYAFIHILSTDYITTTILC